VHRLRARGDGFFIVRLAAEKREKIMRSKKRFMCRILALFVGWEWLVMAEMVACAGVLPPGSTVGGSTIAEWTADWWNWAVMEPSATNPVVDPTGEFAGINQPGRPVFFVAGTFGGSVTRTFDVDVGTHLLVPMLNVTAWAPEDGPNEASLRTLANEAMDDVSELHFSLDGVPLANPFDYREESPVFTLSIPPGSVYTECCGLAAGDRDPAVSDGYWVMLEPLSPGPHLLEFGGVVGGDGPLAGFAVDVTANLNVVPAGRSGRFSAIPEPTTRFLLFSAAFIGMAGNFMRPRVPVNGRRAEHDGRK